MPTRRCRKARRALMTAARTGKVDAVRVLLAHGASVNAKERWKQQTALMWAAHEGNAEAVKLLLEAGANARRPIDLRLDAAAVCRTPGTGRHDQGARSPPARTSTTPCRTGPARWSPRFRASTTRPPASCWSTAIDPNAAGQGWTALHQIVWSRRPQRGQNNPGQKPQGDLSSLDLAKKLVAAWRRHQCPRRRRSPTRTWKAATA